MKSYISALGETHSNDSGSAHDGNSSFCSPAPLAQETAFSLAAAAICGNVTDTREKKRLPMVK